MGVVKRMPQPGGLKDGEVGVILTLMGEYENRLNLVRSEYESLFGRVIPMKVLKDIQLKYDAVLAEKLDDVNKQLVKIPLAKLSYRLRVLQMLLKKAMKVRIRYSIKVDAECFEQVYEENLRMALEVVRTADRMCNEAKRLEIEEYRAKMIPLPGGEGDEHDSDGSTSDNSDSEEASEAQG